MGFVCIECLLRFESHSEPGFKDAPQKGTGTQEVLLLAIWIDRRTLVVHQLLAIAIVTAVCGVFACPFQ